MLYTKSPFHSIASSLSFELLILPCVEFKLTCVMVMIHTDRNIFLSVPSTLLIQICTKQFTKHCKASPTKAKTLSTLESYWTLIRGVIVWIMFSTLGNTINTNQLSNTCSEKEKVLPISLLCFHVYLKIYDTCAQCTLCMYILLLVIQSWLISNYFNMLSHLNCIQFFL